MDGVADLLAQAPAAALGVLEVLADAAGDLARRSAGHLGVDGDRKAGDLPELLGDEPALLVVRPSVD
eukprot:8489829-Alexandrium_andersonii.AAC.1